MNYIKVATFVSEIILYKIKKMKRLKLLLIAVLTVFLGTTFSSCSDDDDTYNSDYLVGEWVCVRSKGYIKVDGETVNSWDTTTPPIYNYDDYNLVGSYYIFDEDRYFESRSYFGSIWIGEWKLKGDKIYLIDSDFNDTEGIATITTLDETTLVIESSYKEKEDGIVYEGQIKHSFRRTEAY